MKMASFTDMAFQNQVAWLSVLWFVLCWTLVSKYNDLIGIFYAFIGSFALAVCLSSVPLNLSEEKTTQAARQSHRQTKDLVGLVACTLSFWFLGREKGEFYALSASAGYLAFDLWFSTLFCRQVPPPILSLLEDASSLTIFLVSLTLYKDLLADKHTLILGWVVYKTMLLISSIASRNTKSAGTTAPRHSIERSSMTWKIHGTEYDLSPFLSIHPGGKEAIELARGRDCTALFESYHPFTTKHRMVLKKYLIDQSTPVKTSDEDAFYNVLKERVAKSLRDQGIDPEKERTAPPGRVVYYCLVTTCLLFSCYSHAKGSMIGSFLFGVFGWLVGALGHDAGHFACSRRAWINDICVWAMSLLCNPVMWQHQHTFAHHSFTNEFDHDPDLHHFHLLVRVHRHVKQDKQYQNQKHSAFVFMAYTLVTFGTCFWIPLDMMQTGFLHGIVEWSDRGRLLRALGMFAHMIGFVLLVLVTPFMSLPWYKAIAAVVIHLATSGMLFGIFSQVNHLNEASLEADSNTRSHSNRPDELKKSWAAAQVETSNNFAPNSFLWHILSNGLNLQIEHHLFPSINHSHLPRIAPIVEQTCKEYGVQYKCYKSWREVMAATLEWLDRLATDK